MTLTKGKKHEKEQLLDLLDKDIKSAQFIQPIKLKKKKPTTKPPPPPKKKAITIKTDKVNHSQMPKYPV